MGRRKKKGAAAATKSDVSPCRGTAPESEDLPKGDCSLSSLGGWSGLLSPVGDPEASGHAIDKDIERSTSVGDVSTVTGTQASPETVTADTSGMIEIEPDEDEEEMDDFDWFAAVSEEVAEGTADGTGEEAVQEEVEVEEEGAEEDEGVVDEEVEAEEEAEDEVVGETSEAPAAQAEMEVVVLVDDDDDDHVEGKADSKPGTKAVMPNPCKEKFVPTRAPIAKRPPKAGAPRVPPSRSNAIKSVPVSTAKAGIRPVPGPRQPSFPPKGAALGRSAKANPPGLAVTGPTRSTSNPKLLVRSSSTGAMSNGKGLNLKRQNSVPLEGPGKRPKGPFVIGHGSSGGGPGGSIQPKAHQGQIAASDNEGRRYDLNHVVVNFANVGATYSKKVLGKQKERGDKLFDWEGVRRCVTKLRNEHGLSVVGVIYENFMAPDRGRTVPSGVPKDIQNLCESIEETPRLTGSNHGSADDEMTIKCAYHRNCRFMDNDNYRDWKQQMRDEKIRNWLDKCQDLLHMRYFFDSGLGNFDTLDGNIPPGLLASHKGVMPRTVSKKELWTAPRN